MGGKEGALGNDFEIRVFADLIIDQLVAAHAGSSSRFDWITEQVTRILPQRSKENHEIDFVVEIGTRDQLWISAKSNYPTKCRAIRDDVERMRKSRRISSDRTRFILAVDAATRYSQQWMKLRAELETLRSDTDHSIDDILRMLGIDPPSNSRSRQAWNSFLSRLFVWIVDSAAENSLLRAQNTGLLYESTTDAMTSLREAIIAYLPVQPKTKRFAPVDFTVLQADLRERRLIRSVAIAERDAIAEARRSADQLRDAVSKPRGEHALARLDLRRKLEDWIERGNVLITSEKGTGKTTLLLQAVPSSREDSLVVRAREIANEPEVWSRPKGISGRQLLEAWKRQGLRRIIIDGVDEASSESQRRELLDFVRRVLAIDGLKVVLCGHPSIASLFQYEIDFEHIASDQWLLTETELKTAIDEDPEALSFLDDQSARRLRALVRKVMFLDLVRRLRRDGRPQRSFGPTRFGLIHEFWRYLFSRCRESEPAALQLAGRLLHSQRIKRGELSQDPNALRDRAIVSGPDSDLVFSHSLYREYATARALLEGAVPEKSLASWLLENSDPLLRDGVIHAAVASELAEETAAKSMPRSIRELLDDTRLDEIVFAIVVQAIVENARSEHLSEAMEAIRRSAPQKLVMALVHWFEASKGRTSQDSTEIDFQLASLKQAIQAVEASGDEDRLDLYNRWIRWAKAVVSSIPRARIANCRDELLSIKTIAVGVATPLGFTRSQVESDWIDIMFRLLEAQPSELAQWAIAHAKAEHFAYWIFARVRDLARESPDTAIEVWERVALEVADPGRRQGREGNAWCAQQAIDLLLRARPYEATRAIVRVLARKIPRVDSISRNPDQSLRYGEDGSEQKGADIFRQTDGWIGFASSLTDAWSQWSFELRDSGGSESLSKSLRAVEEHATTAFPILLVLEWAEQQTDYSKLPAEFRDPLSRLLEQPRLMALPSIGSTAGCALARLIDHDDSQWSHWVELAEGLVSAAEGWGDLITVGERQALSNLLSHLEKTKRPSAQSLRDRVTKLAGIPRTRLEYHFSGGGLGFVVAETTQLSRALLERAWASQRVVANPKALVQVERALSEEAERIADAWTAEKFDDFVWVRGIAARIANSAEPSADPDSASDLGWSNGGRCVAVRLFARIGSLLKTANQPDLSPEERATIKRLSEDPNPFVRAACGRGAGGFAAADARWTLDLVLHMVEALDGPFADRILLRTLEGIRWAGFQDRATHLYILELAVRFAVAHEPDIAERLRQEIGWHISNFGCCFGDDEWFVLLEAVLATNQPGYAGVICDIAKQYVDMERLQNPDSLHHSLRTLGELLADSRGDLRFESAYSISYRLHHATSRWRILNAPHVWGRMLAAIRELPNSTAWHRRMILDSAGSAIGESPDQAFDLIEATIPPVDMVGPFSREVDTKEFAKVALDAFSRIADHRGTKTERTRILALVDRLRRFDPAAVGQFVESLRSNES